MEKVGGTVVSQSLKAGLFALVFSCVGVLLLALFAKIFGISDSVLSVINQILKAVAIIAGTAISVKERKFLPKAILGAVIFVLLSFALSAALGGNFGWGVMLDFAVALVCACVTAALKSRKA